MGAIIRRITADWSPKNEGYKFVNAIRGQRGGAGLWLAFSMPGCALVFACHAHA